MSPFTYNREAALPSALTRLAVPGQMAIGGGTDLLVTIDEGLAHPDGVVDVRALAELLGISSEADGSLRVGGACRLADIAQHQLVRERYPLLASACDQVGTPAIRAMATLGGNLAQRPRCWYFRRGIECHKTGGSTCPAEHGENQYLAIVEGGRDDFARVLQALRATDALTYARAVAEREADAARRALWAVPASSYKDSLLELASFSVVRRS